MDDFDLVGDICESCRHTLGPADVCPSCGWHVPQVEAPLVQHDPYLGDDLPRVHG